MDTTKLSNHSITNNLDPTTAGSQLGQQLKMMFRCLWDKEPTDSLKQKRRRSPSRGDIKSSEDQIWKFRVVTKKNLLTKCLHWSTTGYIVKSRRARTDKKTVFKQALLKLNTGNPYLGQTKPKSIRAFSCPWSRIRKEWTQQRVLLIGAASIN